jgi:hypothetical protein
MSTTFQNQTFLFTGTLSEFTRKEAEELVESNGGKVLSGVSAKLNYLVVGEDAGSKLEKAKATGTVKIITEKEFIKLTLMQPNKDISFSIRIWSKNYNNKKAISTLVKLTPEDLIKSNWLQSRISAVSFSSNIEFINWVVFVSKIIDELYSESIIDRWYYDGPSNFDLDIETIQANVNNKPIELNIDDFSSDKNLLDLLKGKGSMRDSRDFKDFGEIHEYQILPFAYYFIHSGSIVCGEDFIELDYPSGSNIENWDESERGWEIVMA